MTYREFPETSPVAGAYWAIATAEQDRQLRELLESTAVKFMVDDGDETYFRYWVDDSLKIRTCLECKISEFKSLSDGNWCVYLTEERLFWLRQQMEKGNEPWHCSLCEKWSYRWKGT